MLAFPDQVATTPQVSLPSRDEDRGTIIEKKSQMMIVFEWISDFESLIRETLHKAILF